MADAIYRQWLMLKTIPRYPRKIDAASIERQLADQGFAIHRRTIQRDLVNLSSIFPLRCDDEHKPYGWYWTKEAAVFDIPNMDPHTALTFQLVKDFMHHLMPPATLSSLASHFKRAQEVLSSVSEPGFKKWPQSVRVIPQGQPLLPPDVSPEILETVYEAIRLGRKLRITYRPRGSEKRKTYEINPLGLIFRGSIIHLICSMWNYENVVQLVLHRMEKATLLETPLFAPKDFDLDKYIKEGNMGFLLEEKPIKLKVRFKKEAAAHLYETPLSEDQRITKDGEDHLILRATIFNTVFLRVWLLGFGSAAEVLIPKRLREQMAEEVREKYAKYNHD